MKTELRGREKTVIIDRDGPVVVIGERINPTGKSQLAEALRESDMAYVRELARQQIANGADMLDVNVGAAGVDEEEALPLAVEAVVNEVGVPIVIDSTHETALPKALSVVCDGVVPGRPLINSVNGEEDSLRRLLPLVKEYDTAVIGLTMDDNGIPDDADGRLAIADRILERAAQHGISANDVIIDCLTLTVGADSRAAITTLRTTELVREKLGANVCLGASNVSFGLPQRGKVNNLFLAMAVLAGMNVAIVNPAAAKEAILIADLIMGRDEFATRYLDYFRAHKDDV
jgi:5-methyltetrahydrofolate--homocysteine methyltransferase